MSEMTHNRSTYIELVHDEDTKLSIDMRVLQEVGFHDFVYSPSFVMTSLDFFLFESKISKH